MSREVFGCVLGFKNKWHEDVGVHLSNVFHSNVHTGVLPR